MRGTVRRAPDRVAQSCSGERARRRSIGFAVLIAVLVVPAAVVVVPAAVVALDVRGTLQVPSDLASMTPQPTDAERARQRYWEEWNGVLDPRAPRLDAPRELAVVLTGAGPVSTGEQPPFRIHNGSLAPATIVARAGTAISIRNDDGIAYEIFADGNTDFGPIQTAPGNARPVTLTAPGSWPVRDRVHPHVRGHVHAVADLVARAFVERDGSFVFRGVTAGTYTLRVFQGERELSSQEITVPEGGTFTVPPLSLSAAPSAPAAAPAAPAAP